MPGLWLLVLLGFAALVLATWPLIQRMARDRLLNVRNADGSIHFVEEQKVTALRRIAFVFLLVTGTQWLGAALRTPIFQEYVSVEAERVAREYSIWSIIPMILVYNVLTSLVRPQVLVYRICYGYAIVLLLLALYVAVLDAHGGKNGVRAWDDASSGAAQQQLTAGGLLGSATAYLTTAGGYLTGGAGAASSSGAPAGGPSRQAGAPDVFWQQGFRHFVVYALFIVVETRSVILNGMIMSFLQLYMGATSKAFSVACFAFMNFWQQIGIMMFLFSGSISRFMRIDLGEEGYSISGSVVLTVVISLVTMLIAELAVPAYDALEQCKLQEEADDPDIPAEARIQGLLNSANATTSTRGGGGGRGAGAGSQPPATFSNSNDHLISHADGKGGLAPAFPVPSHLARKSSSKNYNMNTSFTSVDNPAHSTMTSSARTTSSTEANTTQQQQQHIWHGQEYRLHQQPPSATSSELVHRTNIRVVDHEEEEVDHISEFCSSARSAASNRVLLNDSREDQHHLQMGSSSGAGTSLRNVTSGKVSEDEEEKQPLISELNRVDTPPGSEIIDVDTTKSAATSNPGSTRQQPLSLAERVELLQSYLYKKAGGAGSGTKTTSSISGSTAAGTAAVGSSTALQAIRKQLYNSVEGLWLIVSHRYVLLLFLVSYSNLPIRQMIDIQLAVLLAGIYPCPPDAGDSLAGPSCTAMKDQKLTLMTACGLVAGALNAVVNALCTQQLVKRLGVRFTLVLNPLLGLVCLLIFAGSEFFSVHHSWTQVNGDKSLSYTSTFIPWNDRASLLPDAVPACLLFSFYSYDSSSAVPIRILPLQAVVPSEGLPPLSHFDKECKSKYCSCGQSTSWNSLKINMQQQVNVVEGAAVVEYATYSSDGGAPQYAGKIVSYEWAKHLALATPVTENNLPLVDEKNRANFEVLTHLQQKTDSIEKCTQLCAKHYRECAFLTFHAQATTCTLFGKHKLPDSLKGPALDGAAVFAPGQSFHSLASPRTFAQVARELQQAGAAAAVFVVSRSVNQVAEQHDGEVGNDHGDLALLTVMLGDKDWSGPLGHGENLHRLERVPGNDSGLSFLQRYLLVAVFWMLWSSIHFSVCNPTIAVLMLRTTPKVKVKAKSWSNSFGNNLMKMLGNRTNNILNVPLFMVLPSIAAGCGWIAFWLVCALTLGSMYAVLEEKNEYVGGYEEEDAARPYPGGATSTTPAVAVR
ncbi:unnamed protein product [Amoebophrya sp. A120]|nr:unnamed protein product [Amoebophrya sp. A120]|eukprot:GSA120T00022808001.1